MMKYIQKYDDYINEGIDFNIDILKLILVVGISTLLGKLIIIFIKRFKSNLGKKLLGTFDPVLQNKIKNYEDSLESKFDKKELDELFQTFYSDNVLQSYIKKINAAHSDDEKRYLMEQCDNYIKTKLKPEQYKALNMVSFRGDLDYQVTPHNVKEFDGILKKLFTDINKYLNDQKMSPIENFDITGSAFYWNKDIHDNPNKRYGDIDAIITLPLLQFSGEMKAKNLDEEKTLELYNNIILKFIQDIQPDYIDANLTFHLNRNKLNKKMIRGISVAVFINDGMTLLVDFIPTFGPYREWTIDRLTPEHNYKGITYGRVYTAIEKHLLIEIGDTGVHAWLTPRSNTLKSRFDTGSKQIHNISRNYQTCLLDIANWLGTVAGIEEGQMKIDSLLHLNPGMSRDNINLHILLKGVRGLIKTLDKNNIFSKGIIPEIHSGKECMDLIYNTYLDEMNKRLHNIKFNNRNDILLMADYDKTVIAVDYAKAIAKKWLT